MTRFSTPSRLLVTAILAAWLPLCFCQATGAVRLAFSLAGLATAAGVSDCGSCCLKHKQEPDAPMTAQSRTACCTITLKIAPRPDRWTPGEDTCGSVLAAAAVPDLSAPPSLAAHLPRPYEQAAPPLAAAQTLLRQHCALTI